MPMPNYREQALDHKWRGMLECHLQRCFPEMFEDLKKSGKLEEHLTVRVASAIQELDEDGPARESSILSDLLPVPEEEWDQAEDWELEGAEADMEAAIMKMAEKPPKKPSAKS
mgnify:CR=1 FL=1